MNEKFTKPNVSAIDKNEISLEGVEEQLKSMQLGYIAHSFVLRDLGDQFDKFHSDNFKDFDEATIKEAEKHALRQLRNPEYYQGETMKSIPDNVQQCFQALMMINKKRDQLEAKESEVEVARQNIIWLKELIAEMRETKEEATNSTI